MPLRVVLCLFLSLVYCQDVFAVSGRDRRALAVDQTTASRANNKTLEINKRQSSSRSPSEPGVVSKRGITTAKNVVARGSVANVKTQMESKKELEESCKKQYVACMDNFCNKIDENMARCSCSKNINNYAKTENALYAANQELQDVAQKIQYIGLTPAEIKTLFTQTVAEDVMQNTSDSSKIKNDLTRIKNSLVDVKTGSATAVTSDSGISLDISNLLDFNIDSQGFDISSLFGIGTGNTQSISNQRGEALYKTAAARCKSAVLNNCASYGIDTSVIINGYDLQIDKDCMLYERKLTDENDAMLSTVRNAKTVLQKARLTVSQQKNQYDLRGCVGALDSCMQDDFVCGENYIDCVDPSGKFVVNGKVVEGSLPGMPGGTFGADGKSATATSGLYTAWNYDSKNIYASGAVTPYTLQDYISATMKQNSSKTRTSTDISSWLQSKMGYHDNTSGQNFGMCISVLNKCQKYTYDSDGKYLGSNVVISNWLERAIQKIKKSQDDLLINYGSTCLGEVSNCLSQNNSGTNPSDMMVRTCLPVINTCRSVTGGLDSASVQTQEITDVYAWLDSALHTTFIAVRADACAASGGTWKDDDNTCDCSALVNGVQSSDNLTCRCQDEYVLSENKQNACFMPAENACRKQQGMYWDADTQKCITVAQHEHNLLSETDRCLDYANYYVDAKISHDGLMCIITSDFDPYEGIALDNDIPCASLAEDEGGIIVVGYWPQGSFHGKDIPTSCVYLLKSKYDVIKQKCLAMGGTIVVPSAQNLFECNKATVPQELRGNEDAVNQYIKDTFGTDHEASYPYVTNTYPYSLIDFTLYSWQDVRGDDLGGDCWTGLYLNSDGECWCSDESTRELNCVYYHEEGYVRNTRTGMRYAIYRYTFSNYYNSPASAIQTNGSAACEAIGGVLSGNKCVIRDGTQQRAVIVTVNQSDSVASITFGNNTVLTDFENVCTSSSGTWHDSDSDTFVYCDCGNGKVWNGIQKDATGCELAE